MSTDIQIIPLERTRRNIGRFLEVPYGIYRDDPNWVAPLLSDLAKVFTEDNPLFQHSTMQLWVATKGGRDVGRIMGLRDETAPTLAEGASVSFGFFEATNDREVSRALFKAVADWAKALGIVRLVGPLNPTTNDECGLLIEGFDSPPVFMMPYNPKYYVDLLEQEGFTKAKDLLAFMIELAGIPMDRLHRIGGIVKKRNPTISLRPVRRKTLQDDLGKVKEVYNAAWEDNWGFVPMTDAEIDFMAERLKPLLMEGLVWLAEDGPEPIGFLLASPDYNVALQPLKGKLLTPKIVGFLPYLFGWKLPPRTRVLTLGVKHKYRGRGIETAMLIQGLDVGFKAGFKESEASWILEDNVLMCRMLEAIGGRIYKRYRIYEKRMTV